MRALGGKCCWFKGPVVGLTGQQWPRSHKGVMERTNRCLHLDFRLSNLEKGGM